MLDHSSNNYCAIYSQMRWVFTVGVLTHHTCFGSKAAVRNLCSQSIMNWPLVFLSRAFFILESFPRTSPVPQLSISNQFKKQPILGISARFAIKGTLNSCNFCCFLIKQRLQRTMVQDKCFKSLNNEPCLWGKEDTAAPGLISRFRKYKLQMNVGF